MIVNEKTGRIRVRRKFSFRHFKYIRVLEEEWQYCTDVSFAGPGATTTETYWKEVKPNVERKRKT